MYFGVFFLGLAASDRVYKTGKLQSIRAATQTHLLISGNKLYLRCVEAISQEFL